MPLSSKAISYLRSESHHLKPLVIVGKAGLSEQLVQEVESVLEVKELIKVKFNEHKESKDELGIELISRTGAVLVQRLGNVLTLYRENPKLEDQITLPS